MRFLLCTIFPAVVSACSCLESGPPCDAAWKASVVFSGTVVELTRDAMQPDNGGGLLVNGYLGTHAIFEVAEGFIGMEGRGRRIEIRTGIGGGDCGYPFERSEKYVVYASENKDGILVANICSRTAPEHRSQADLAYLRSSRFAGPFGYIYGMAGSAEGGSHFDEALKMWLPLGISGVAVTLTGPDKSARVMTGDDGSFRFDRLSPGEYSVSVAKDGYRWQGGSTALNVHAGGCAYAAETLVPISGTLAK